MRIMSEQDTEGKKLAAADIRRSFLSYLTEDSLTKDGIRKEFNQAIFDKEKGFACFNGTDLDMVMSKFDKTIAFLLRGK